MLIQYIIIIIILIIIKNVTILIYYSNNKGLNQNSGLTDLEYQYTSIVIISNFDKFYSLST